MWATHYTDCEAWKVIHSVGQFLESPLLEFFFFFSLFPIVLASVASRSMHPTLALANPNTICLVYGIWKTRNNLIRSIKNCKNVNDRFNVWNHRQSKVQPTGPPFTSLFTEEASMIKCLALDHKLDSNPLFPIERLTLEPLGKPGLIRGVAERHLADVRQLLNTYFGTS